MQEVIVTGDLIDSARPGDEVDLTGRFTNNFDTSLNTQQGFPVFSTVIEANSLLARRDAAGSLVVSSEDETQIKALAASGDFERRFFSSVAPSLCGHEEVKRAVALALFGGAWECRGGFIQREGECEAPDPRGY